MRVWEKSAEAVVVRKAWKQAGQIFAPAKSAFPPSVAVSEGPKESRYDERTPVKTRVVI
jgi:hypothetical protein